MSTKKSDWSVARNGPGGSWQLFRRGTPYGRFRYGFNRRTANGEQLYQRKSDSWVGEGKYHKKKSCRKRRITGRGAYEGTQDADVAITQQSYVGDGLRTTDIGAMDPNPREPFIPSNPYVPPGVPSSNNPPPTKKFMYGMWVDDVGTGPAVADPWNNKWNNKPSVYYQPSYQGIEGAGNKGYVKPQTVFHPGDDQYHTPNQLRDMDIEEHIKRGKEIEAGKADIARRRAAEAAHQQANTRPNGYGSGAGDLFGSLTGTTPFNGYNYQFTPQPENPLIQSTRAIMSTGLDAMLTPIVPPLVNFLHVASPVAFEIQKALKTITGNAPKKTEYHLSDEKKRAHWTQPGFRNPTKRQNF